MTRYELREIERAAFTAALAVAKVTMALFLAHEKHAQGRDDEAADYVEVANGHVVALEQAVNERRRGRR